MSPLWYILALLPVLGSSGERFSCRGRILGAYYADAKSGCKAFHVCVRVLGGGVRDFRFFCPPGTLFHQEAQTCTDWGDDDPLACPADLYDGQFDLYKIGSGFDTKKLSSTTTNNREEESDFGLQRAETGDRRLSHNASPAPSAPASDLRAAHSSDFFSGQRDRGRDDTPAPSQPAPVRQSFRRPTPRAQPTSPSTPTVSSTRPTTFLPQQEPTRKFKVVRKRPQGQHSSPSTLAPSTFAQNSTPRPYYQDQRQTYQEQQKQNYPEQQRQNYPEQQKQNYQEQHKQNYQEPQKQNYLEQQKQNYQEQQRQNYPEQQKSNYQEQQKQNYPEQRQNYQEQQRQNYQEQQRQNYPEQQRQNHQEQQKYNQAEQRPNYSEQKRPSYSEQPRQSFQDDSQQNYIRRPENRPKQQTSSPLPQYSEEYVEVSRVTPKQTKSRRPTASTQQPTTAHFTKKDGLTEVYNYEAQSTTGFNDNRSFKTTLRNSFSVSPINRDYENVTPRKNVEIKSNGDRRPQDFPNGQKYQGSSTPSYSSANSLSYEPEKNNYFQGKQTQQPINVIYTTARPEAPLNLNTVAYKTNIGFDARPNNFADHDEDDGQYRLPAGEDDGQYRPELYEKELLSGAHSLNIVASGNRLPEDQKPKGKPFEKASTKPAVPRPFTLPSSPSLPSRAPEPTYTTTFRPQPTSPQRTFDYFQTYTTTSRPNESPVQNIPNRYAQSNIVTNKPSTNILRASSEARALPTNPAPVAASTVPPKPPTHKTPALPPASKKDYDYAYYDTDSGFTEYDHIEEFGKTNKKV